MKDSGDRGQINVTTKELTMRKNAEKMAQVVDTENIEEPLILKNKRQEKEANV